MDAQILFLLGFAACMLASTRVGSPGCRARLDAWLGSAGAMTADGADPAPATPGERTELEQLRARVQALEAVISEREYELNEKLRRL